MNNLLVAQSVILFFDDHKQKQDGAELCKLKTAKASYLNSFWVASLC